jgi:hypothetical protein
VDLEKMAEKAKQVIDERGGMEALKEDVEELKNIAQSHESLAEKAKEAAQAIKVPGNPAAHQHQQEQ